MEGARSKVEIFPTRAEVWKAAADRFVTASGEAIRARGRFTVALSGGESPSGLYKLLASAPYVYQVDWRFVQICWGDERCVPPDDPESNFRMAREALLDHVPVPAENIHRIRGEDDPVTAAEACERELRELFSANPSTKAAAESGARTFDLVLLGLGEEGHAASLFPAGAAINEARRWVVAERVAKLGRWRVTLTPTCINAAAEILFLVLGREKAAILRRVLKDSPRPSLLPAQAIAARFGRLTWLVDAEAGAGISTAGQG